MAISKSVLLGLFMANVQLIFTQDCYTDSTSITFTTGTNYVYNWESIFVSPSTTNLTFQVKASADVHIGLSAQNRNLPNFYEIGIGIQQNTHSTIRQGAQNNFQDYQPQETPNILDRDEFREFTISWQNGRIQVHRTGDSSPFLEYKHTSPFPIQFIGFTTGYGSTGEFVFCAIDSEIALADKVTSQSSITHGGISTRAVDGNQNGNYNGEKSCTHTGGDTNGGWWTVDLGLTVRIEVVLVYNRVDCCKDRLDGAVVRIGDDSDRNNPECGTVSSEQIADGQLIIMMCDLSGRYLSIQARPSEILTLCEVKVFENLMTYTDIPLMGRVPSQSSLSSGGLPDLAVDGNTDGNYNMGQTCSQTLSEQGPFPWWMIDLDEPFQVNKVVVYNRDDCCVELLDGAIVRLGDDPNRASNPTCGTVTTQQIAIGPEIIFYCDMMVGRYLSIEQTRSNPLTLCEVKLYGNEYTYTTTISATSMTVLVEGSTDSPNGNGTDDSGVVPALVSVIVMLLLLLIAGALWMLYRRRSKNKKERASPTPEQPSATFQNSNYSKPDSKATNDQDDGYIGLSEDREDNTYAELQIENHPNNDLNYYEAGPSEVSRSSRSGEKPRTRDRNSGLVDIYAKSIYGGPPLPDPDDSEYAYVNSSGNDVNNDHKSNDILFDPDDEEYCVVR